MKTAIEIRGLTRTWASRCCLLMAAGCETRSRCRLIWTVMKTISRQRDTVGETMRTINSEWTLSSWSPTCTIMTQSPKVSHLIATAKGQVQERREMPNMEKFRRAYLIRIIPLSPILRVVLMGIQLMESIKVMVIPLSSLVRSVGWTWSCATGFEISRLLRMSRAWSRRRYRTTRAKSSKRGYSRWLTCSSLSILSPTSSLKYQSTSTIRMSKPYTTTCSAGCSGSLHSWSTSWRTRQATLGSLATCCWCILLGTWFHSSTLRITGTKWTTSKCTSTCFRIWPLSRCSLPWSFVCTNG